MSNTASTRNQIGIDQAFRYAVTLAWEEFKTTKPRAIRVEYLCEPGAALNHLSLWSVKAGGYQDLVFDYEAWTSSTHSGGARFADGHYPEGLAHTLDFIMQHQNQFTRPADAGRPGLVLIYPPDGDDRIEAATWVRGVQSMENETSRGEARKRLEDHRQNRGEEASSRANGQAYPTEGTATAPDATGYSGCEPDEAPAKTIAANYFELRYAWPE